MGCIPSSPEVTQAESCAICALDDLHVVAFTADGLGEDQAFEDFQSSSLDQIISGRIESRGGSLLVAACLELRCGILSSTVRAELSR